MSVLVNALSNHGTFQRKIGGDTPDKISILTFIVPDLTRVRRWIKKIVKIGKFNLMIIWMQRRMSTSLDYQIRL